MSSSTFYRDQATQQQSAADAATLDNVRDRCQRAANAWADLAARSERADSARSEAALGKLAAATGESHDRGPAIG